MQNLNCLALPAMAGPDGSAPGDRPASVSRLEMIVYGLIERFISSGPCQETAAALRRELELHGLVRPSLYALQHQDFLLSPGVMADVPGDQLLRVCQRLISIVDEEIPLNSALGSALPSLLRRGRYSVFRSRETMAVKIWDVEDLTNRSHGALVVASACTQNKFNVHNVIRARRMTGLPYSPAHFSKAIASRMRLQLDVSCHLASVFCVTFDMTGQYVITGADDGLVKVWNAELGRLQFTFRCLRTSVTDLEVDQENKLVGASCNDRLLAVWQLKDGKAVNVLKLHEGVVSRICFVPYYDVNKRYLVSTGFDGFVSFVRWNPAEGCFHNRAEKFNVQNKPNGRLTSITSSDGGTMVAVCGSGCSTAIFSLLEDSPTLIERIVSGCDPVAGICWAYRGLRFLTTTVKNGHVKVWHFERQSWKSLLLNFKQTLPQEPEPAASRRARARYIAWNCNDTRAVVACTDNRVRVFEPLKGTLLRYLAGKALAVTNLEAHPIDPDIMAFSGREDRIVVWNINDGTVIFEQTLRQMEPERGTINMVVYSPDGARLCAVDTHGQLHLMGVGQRDYNVPLEQFFHTDYGHFASDEQGFAVDELQMPLHLLSPPFLVNSEGLPYPPEIQRLVPGRENSPEEHLVPDFPLRQVVVNNEDEMIQVFVPERGWPQNSRNGPPCCWLSRILVPPLQQAVIDLDILKIRRMAEDERLMYELEADKDRAAEPVVEHARRRQNRQDQAAPAAAAAAAAAAAVPDPPEAMPDSDYDDDPDYTEVEPPHVSRRSGVRTRQGHANSGSGLEEDDEEEEEEEDQADSDNDTSPDDSSTSSSSSSSLSSNSYDSDVVEMVVDQRPRVGRHREVARRRRRIRRAAVVRRSPTPHPAAGSPLAAAGAAAAVEPFLFSDWITCTTNRTFPYFPQKGDEVVYFPQGHRLYVNAVRLNHLYRVRDRELPWRLLTLADEEFAVVEEVSFQLLEVRLCRLVLSKVERNSSTATETRFVVQFHDMVDVADFIVLRQFYANSIRRRWRPNERFQTLIDDSWWIGTIVRREPFDEHLPNSNFQCLVVVWEDGTEERLSPWDIQPVAVDERERARQACMWKYRPKACEWPARGMDAECQRISLGIGKLMSEYAFTEPFLEPVDVNAYPAYASVIEYPSDLGTIKRRLENRFYRRLEVVKSDAMYISKNARTFNIPNSSIIQKADLLTRVLLKFIDRTNCFDVVQVLEECRADGDSPTGWFDQMSADDWRLECHRALELMRRVDPTVFDRFAPVEHMLFVDGYESPVTFLEDVTRRLDALQRERNAQVRTAAAQMRDELQEHSELIMDHWRRSLLSAAAAPAFNTRSGGARTRTRVDSNSEMEYATDGSSVGPATSAVDEQDEGGRVSDEEYVEASSSGHSRCNVRPRRNNSARPESAERPTALPYALRRKRARRQVNYTSSEEEESQTAETLTNGQSSDVVISRSSRGRPIRLRRF